MKRLLVAFTILVLLAVPCMAQTKVSPEGKINLRILYAGMPGTARQKDVVSFLDKHFAAVNSVDFSTFTEQQAQGSDVVILDKDGIQWASRGGNPLSDLKLPQNYRRATLALGIPGSFLYDRMDLKPGYR